jgi:NADPH:quinone reductase-like Zn-dependent oxidoreductase
MEADDGRTATEGAADGDGPGASMRAIIRDRYGPADVLRLAEIDRPVAGDREVLLRVRAAGLDRGTWHQMTGLPYLMRLGTGPRRPRNLVPGLDVAGTVVAVGPAVTGFAVGDEVFGTARGSFAEYAVAKPEKLAHRPPGLAVEQAAVLPVSGVTALRALIDVGRVAAGQQVLITGASGGVGSYAVQLAKASGAEVTAVCGPGKDDLVRSLGADHVLDYTREDFAATGRRYDLILDIAGNPGVRRLRRALTPGGTAVIVGGEGGGSLTGGLDRQLRALLVSPFVGQRLTLAISVESSADLRRLIGHVEAGELTPSIGASYPLDQAPEAMRRLVAGAARGKTVITVG